MLYGYDWLYGVIWPQFVPVRGYILRKGAFSEESTQSWEERFGENRGHIEQMINHVHLWDALAGLPEDTPKEVYVYFADFLKKTWESALALQMSDRQFVVQIDVAAGSFGPTITAYQEAPGPDLQAAQSELGDDKVRSESMPPGEKNRGYDLSELHKVIWPAFRVVHGCVVRSGAIAEDRVRELMQAEAESHQHLEAEINRVGAYELLEPLPRETPNEVFRDFLKFLEKCWARALENSGIEYPMSIEIQDGSEREGPSITVCRAI